jgi:hypothetical protein
MRGFRFCSRAAVGALTFSTLILTAPVAGATPFGEACGITYGWLAVVQAAGTEECHWQEPDGNEHIITNPLPTKPPLAPPVAPPPLAPR